MVKITALSSWRIELQQVGLSDLCVRHHFSILYKFGLNFSGQRWHVVGDHDDRQSHMKQEISWLEVISHINGWKRRTRSYFIFFTHISQYFSITEAPSTWNKASWVATLPQYAQNFVLSLCLVKGLNDVNLFCTWLSSRQSQQVQLLQYYLLEMSPIYTIAWWSCFNSSSLLLIFSRPDNS
jgi:hypothetical protein